MTSDNVRQDAERDQARADRVQEALIGLNREEVIASPGVSKSTVQRALRGEPMRRGTLFALAKALKVSPEWLIEGTGPMHPLVDPTPNEALRDEIAAAIYTAEETTVPELSDIVDLDRMALAIEIVDTCIKEQGVSRSNKLRGFYYTGTYDILRAASERLVRRITGLMVADPGHDP